MRQEQLIIRRQREKERREREKVIIRSLQNFLNFQKTQEERLRKEKEAREKIEAEELKKKELLAAMSMHFTGDRDRYSHLVNRSIYKSKFRADRRKGRRNTARDAKRRILAERRKPLNIDHLNKEKLIEKTQEIYDWYVKLHE